MARGFEGIRRQKFGVEVECTGLTRAAAASAISRVLGGTPHHEGGGYDTYWVRDEQNRIWKIVSDGSIDCEYRNGMPASSYYAVEFVTPILQYEDMPTLQKCVREIRAAGGRCNYSTGIHIHVDASNYTPEKLRNLVNIFASKEDMLYQALQVSENRSAHYCRKVDRSFLERLNREKPKTMAHFKRIWYGDDAPHNLHRDSTRYTCCNLHPVFQHNNFEIRAFNSTLHAGVLRAYISLVLAISNQALTQRSASPTRTVSDNPRFTFRVWLVRIGLNGDEFKNCRMHLLKHLDGNIAWRHPEDALAQRERLRQERRIAREQAVTAAEPPERFSEVGAAPEMAGSVSDSESDFDDDEELDMSM